MVSTHEFYLPWENICLNLKILIINYTSHCLILFPHSAKDAHSLPEGRGVSDPLMVSCPLAQEVLGRGTDAALLGLADSAVLRREEHVPSGAESPILRSVERYYWICVHTIVNSNNSAHSCARFLTALAMLPKSSSSFCLRSLTAAIITSTIPHSSYHNFHDMIAASCVSKKYRRLLERAVM